MSGSRRSLKNAVLFNPRASNEWSKDESKFGQKMLEKMGWKKGQGIGLHNQGTIDNIKVRLKLDNKGLGYKINDDQWLEVRNEFSELLSQLSQNLENETNSLNKEKKSLAAVSQSSRTRVHYQKFTHGKDIAKYKKEDLVGILGKKEDDSILMDKKEFIQSGNMNDYFKNKMKSSHDMDYSTENCTFETPSDNDDVKKLVDVKHVSDSTSGCPSSKQRKSKKSVDILCTEIPTEKSLENNEECNIDNQVISKNREKKLNKSSNLDTEDSISNLKEETSRKTIKNSKKLNKNKDKNMGFSSGNKIIEISDNESDMNVNEIIQISDDESDAIVIKVDNVAEIEEQNKKNTTKLNRKKIRKRHVDENVKTNSNEMDPEPILLDDSSIKSKKKKLKHQVQETSENCDIENKDSVVTKINEEVPTRENLQTRLEISQRGGDFMKLVLDYNKYSNVEEHIKDFEKTQEELMNKYREKYKMKYSLSSSEKIEVYGDEFDGRKLDCKQTFESTTSSKHKNDRMMSKAEKIIEKTRLLRSIKDNLVKHNFSGSNLTKISGYGSMIC